MQSLRLFVFGLVSVSFVFYLRERGLGTAKIGWLLTATLLGDAVISLVLVLDHWRRWRIIMMSGSTQRWQPGATPPSTTSGFQS